MMNSLVLGLPLVTVDQSKLIDLNRRQILYTKCHLNCRPNIWELLRNKTDLLSTNLLQYPSISLSIAIGMIQYPGIGIKTRVVVIHHQGVIICSLPGKIFFTPETLTKMEWISTTYCKASFVKVSELQSSYST